MILWVSRWYRPKEKITSAQIADDAIRLLRLKNASPENGDRKSGAPRRRQRTSSR